MNTLDGIAFGESSDNSSAKLMSQISKGTIGKSSNLGSGSLSSNAISKLKNALKKVSNAPIGPSNNLNSSQKKKEAKFYNNLGIPKISLQRLPQVQSQAKLSSHELERNLHHLIRIGVENQRNLKTEFNPLTMRKTSPSDRAISLANHQGPVLEA